MKAAYVWLDVRCKVSHLVLACLVGVESTLAQTAVSRRAAVPRLTMREVRAIELPREIGIRGAHLQSSQAIILWTSDAIYSIGPKAGEMQKICDASFGSPVLVATASKVILVTTMQNDSLFEFELMDDGKCRRTDSGALPGTPLFYRDQIGAGTVLNRRSSVELVQQSFGRNRAQSSLVVPDEWAYRFSSLDQYGLGVDDGEVVHRA